MHAVFVLMTSAWMAGADPAPPPAAPPVAAPAAGACCGGGCGGCGDVCCEKEGFFHKCRKKFGHRHKKDDCCETSCCGTASITAAACCDTGCEKEGCFAKLRKRFHHKKDDCCETTCAAPADCGCGCEKESCFKKFFKKHRHHKDECCDTCNSCAGGACGAPAMPPKAEPIGPPKDQKKMPEGAAIVPVNPDGGVLTPPTKPVINSEVPF